MNNTAKGFLTRLYCIYFTSWAWDRVIWCVLSSYFAYFSGVYLSELYCIHSAVYTSHEERDAEGQCIVGSLVSEKGHFLKIHVNLYL